MSTQLHPYFRIAILILGLSGTFICQNLIYILSFWLIIIVPIFLLLGYSKIHLRLLLIVALPMFLMLGILNYILLNGGTEGIVNAAIVVVRLIVFTSIIQIALIIPSQDLLYTLKKWGLKGDALITIIGAYTVWVDVVDKSLKIVTARYAKGYIKKRSVISGIIQIPSLLIPMIIGILRTAQVRSETWMQKNLIARIEQIESKDMSPFSVSNILPFLIMCLWVIFNVVNRWNLL